MNEKKPIGQLLEELGFINSEQIKIALDVQKINGKYFGETLIELDFVTSSEIAEVVAIQNNLSYINLDTTTPSLEALAVIPSTVASSKNILPLSINNSFFVVASEGPVDLITSDYLQRESGKKVEVRVADKSKIQRLIQIFYQQLKNPIEDNIRKLLLDSSKGVEIDVTYLINLIIQCAIKERATDIHISPEKSVTHIFYRIDGMMQAYFSMPISIHNQVVSKFKILSDLDIAEQRKPQDGSFSFLFFEENFELRISTLPTEFGENIVCRLLGKNGSLFSLSALGISEKNIKKIEHYFSKPYGIILVTGPTGSGKTTTLYSSLRKINPLKKNILTVEDPIEYRFSFIKQTQIHLKSGYDFATALKTFMRQDPDVMLVGEIRDAETAELAIRASITGHLVLSTLHTNTSIGAISRLEDLGIKSYLVGSAVLAIIGQRLARKLCHHCKKEIPISKEALIKKGISSEIVDEYYSGSIFESVGCEHCKNLGYVGRVAIIEILEINEQLESLISQGSSSFVLSKQAKTDGMVSMREDGYIKILQGLSTFEEIDRIVL